MITDLWHDFWITTCAVWSVTCGLLLTIHDTTCNTEFFDTWLMACDSWFDSSHVICNPWLLRCFFYSWHVNCDCQLFTCDLRFFLTQHVTRLLTWFLTSDMRFLTPDMWLLTSGMLFLTPDMWFLTSNMWLDFWHVTSGMRLLTSNMWLDFWHVTWLLTCDSWLLTCDSWLLMCDSWLLTCDSISGMWFLTPDMWLLTSGMWFLTPDMWLDF